MKWNWYEDELPDQEQFNYPLQNSGYVSPEPYESYKPPQQAGGNSWYDWATTSWLPDYDKDAWYNKSLLSQLPGRLGEMGKYSEQYTDPAKPWIEQGYEKLAQPLATPLGVALSVGTLGAGAIGRIAAAAPEAVAASRFLTAAAPAARAATAAAKTTPGLIVGNTIKGALGVGGMLMGAEGLRTAGEAGLDFWKEPSNQKAAEIGGGLLESGLGFFGAKAAVKSMKGRGINVPPKDPALQLGADTTPQQVQAIQATAAEKLAVYTKAQNKSPLTQREADILAEMLPQRPGDPFNIPKVPTEAEALASLNPRPYEAPTPGSALGDISPTAVSPGEIAAKAGGSFFSNAKPPAPGVNVPAPRLGQNVLGPEPPPPPGVEIPLERAQALLDSAAQMQRSGNIDGARTLRQQVADSIRPQYPQWANTIEAQAVGTKFKGNAPPPPPPKNLDPNFNQGMGNPELAGSTPSPRTPPAGPPTPGVVGNVPEQSRIRVDAERKIATEIAERKAAEARAKKQADDELVAKLVADKKSPPEAPSRTPSDIVDAFYRGEVDIPTSGVKIGDITYRKRPNGQIVAVSPGGMETIIPSPGGAPAPVKPPITSPKPAVIETTIEPPGGFTNTRAQKFANRVAELDAAGAPDEAYRGIVFNERTTLKPGETWRDRTIGRISGLEASTAGRTPRAASQVAPPIVEAAPPPVIEKPPIVETAPPIVEKPPPIEASPVVEKPILFEEPAPPPKSGETFWEAKAKLDDRAASGEVMKYDEELVALRKQFGVEAPVRKAKVPVVEKPPVVEAPPVKVEEPVVEKPTKFKGTRAETLKADPVKIEKQKTKLREEGYAVLEPGAETGKWPVVKTLADGSKVMDPRSKFAPKATEPVVEKVPEPAKPIEVEPTETTALTEDRPYTAAEKLAARNAGKTPETTKGLGKRQKDLLDLVDPKIPKTRAEVLAEYEKIAGVDLNTSRNLDRRLDFDKLTKRGFFEETIGKDGISRFTRRPIPESKFKGTRPETKVEPPVEAAPPAAEAAPPKSGKLKSVRAQEIADKVAELDAAGAPDKDYRNALSLAMRREGLEAGETWKGRAEQTISAIEEMTAAEAGSPFSPRNIIKGGEEGSVFFGRGRRTQARQRAAEVASKIVEPVPESKFGLSPSEMAARQKHGVPELGEAGPTVKVTKDWQPKAEKPLKTVEEIIQTAYGKKTATPIRGLYESSELRAFDKEQNIFDRAYRKEQGTEKLTNYFARTQRLARKAGVSFDSTFEKMWDNTETEIAAVFGDKVRGKYPNTSKKPGFSFDKIYEDMQTGRAGGLKPKYEEPSKLVSFLENDLRRKIGRNEAFRDLKAAGHVKAGTRSDMPVGENWEQIDPKIIPGQTRYRTITDAATGKEVSVPTEFFAKASGKWDPRADTAEKLDAFYRGPNKALKFVADVFAFPKNIFLSGGVPFTSINKHAWNLSNRAYKQGGVPEVMRFLKANKGNQDFKSLIRFVEAGLQSSAEDVSIESLSGEGVKRLVEKAPGGKFAVRRVENLQNIYEKPLFKDKLPSFKTSSMKAEVQRGVDAGLTLEQAERRAADITNLFYGGISETPQAWLANHPNIQQGVRIGALAPDWLQTKVKLGGRELAALAGKQDPVYLESFQRGFATTLGRRTVAIALGKAAYDQYYPGVISTGTATEAPKEGPSRARGIDLLGTSDELQRLPEMFYKGAKTGDFRPLTRSLFVNQLNLPARTAYNLSEGESATNEPLWTVKGKFGRPITRTAATIAVIGEASAIFTPPVVNALVRYSQGKTTREEAFMEAGELPLVYHYIDKIDGSSRGNRSSSRR